MSIIVTVLRVHLRSGMAQPIPGERCPCPVLVSRELHSVRTLYLIGLQAL